MTAHVQTAPAVRALDRRAFLGDLPRLEAFIRRGGPAPLSRHPSWLAVLEDGLRHRCHLLEAVQGGQVLGLLGLAYLKSPWFGRFLVSLPYLNYGGVMADDDLVAAALVDHAVRLADQWKVRYLELRQERGVDHPALAHRMAAKVNMRLRLPGTADELWSMLGSKVRNQVRKGQKSGLAVEWGGPERLAEFYAVFSRTMRDLGTPTYGRGLFAGILRQFPGRAEVCVVRAGREPVAAALLLHGWGITEVPSAGALRAHHATCANMLMYYHLLERAVRRGQALFDFGRSTRESNTYRFKRQWGAEPAPTEWQYYVRDGAVGEMRPDNPRFQRAIRLWRRLPVRLTRLLGPPIVRGIP